MIKTSDGVLDPGWVLALIMTSSDQCFRHSSWRNTSIKMWFPPCGRRYRCPLPLYNSLENRIHSSQDNWKSINFWTKSLHHRPKLGNQNINRMHLHNLIPIDVLYHCTKYKKNRKSVFLENWLSIFVSYRHTYKSDLIGPFFRGSKNLILKFQWIGHNYANSQSCGVCW